MKTSKKKKVLKKVKAPKKLPKAKTKAALKIKAKTKSSAKVKKATKVKKLQRAKKPIAKKITDKKRAADKAIFGPVNVRPYAIKKHENYMSKKQSAHFAKILLQWQEQLLSEINSIVLNMQDDVSNYPDPVDRASQEEEFNAELRTRDRCQKLLKKIELALLRIRDDDYGYCNDCGAEIGIRRLEARPTATQCIECKTIAEMREKQIGEVGHF